MDTRTVIAGHSDGELRLAGEIIARGGLVAFPTETVYGLGGDALNQTAARKIFAAKGRPADNPLIVHIADMDQLETLTKSVTDTARRAADAFWPGPLTLILEKSALVPDAVTCGLGTVALRLPRNPVARNLIRAAKRPVAAPSANLSGSPSATDAQAVFQDFNGKIDMIIDGGDCEIGLESTVIDARGPVPVILRPGWVTAEMLERLCGAVRVDAVTPGPDFRPLSPGQKYKHYAPGARITVVYGPPEQVAARIGGLIAASAEKAGVLASDENAALYAGKTVIPLGSGLSPEVVAKALFRAFRRADELGLERVYAEAFGGGGLWPAVMNRLLKAAGYDVIYV